MIYPRKNSLLRGVLWVYVQYILKRNFHRINFNRVDLDSDKSVLLIANHFSWWDGLILFRVFEQLSGKRFHVMLLEETAKAQPMLKYGGAFSIQKGSRDVLKALDFAAELLEDPNNIVLIYPQGKLYSNFVNEIAFEKGILRTMEAAKDKFQLLFATTFIENFNHKKPTANVYLHVATTTAFETIEQLAQTYQQHYEASRQQQNQLVS
jgi:1-acyl-sn-glycerol-3-phosphate acyltransferase